MVTYSDDLKYAYVDGIRFCKDEKTGYYLNTVIHKRLHRFVYERVYGEIPKGYEVHHIDHDKGNNEPDNLQLLTKIEHQHRHGEELTDEQRQWKRENIKANALPAALIWHGSAEGREWHRRHYANTGAAMHSKVERICKQCGRTFEGTLSNANVFCGNNCKSAWRRKSGIDNEHRKCVVCGADFTCNKYSRTMCCSRICARRSRGKGNGDKEAAAGTGL